MDIDLAQRESATEDFTVNTVTHAGEGTLDLVLPTRCQRHLSDVMSGENNYYLGHWGQRWEIGSSKWGRLVADYVGQISDFL